MNTKTSLLAKESPSLYGILKKLFKDDSISLLEDAFKYAYKLGAFDEKPIVRETGMSFNPKPARLASIFIKESGCNSLDIIISTFFIGLKLSEWPFPNINLINISDNICNYKVPNDPAELALFLVYYIDLVRHLHMTTLSNDQKIELISKLKIAMKNHKSKNFLASNQNSINTERLLLVLETAISMQETKLTHLA